MARSEETARFGLQHGRRCGQGRKDCLAPVLRTSSTLVDPDRRIVPATKPLHARRLQWGQVLISRRGRVSSSFDHLSGDLRDLRMSVLPPMKTTSPAQRLSGHVGRVIGPKDEAVTEHPAWESTACFRHFSSLPQPSSCIIFSLP